MIHKSPRQYTEEAIVACGGDETKARHYLHDLAGKDEALLSLLIKSGTDVWIQDFHHKNRGLETVILNGPRVDGLALRQIHRKFWENYTLFGGAIKLCDASIDDLKHSAEQHEIQADGHSKKATFERAIADEIHKASKAKVCDGITNDRLVKMARDLRILNDKESINVA